MKRYRNTGLASKAGSMAPHSSCSPFAHALPTMMTPDRGQVKHPGPERAAVRVRPAR